LRRVLRRRCRSLAVIGQPAPAPSKGVRRALILA
jgi:hypothetical protein